MTATDATAGDGAGDGAPPPRVRIDKWLWRARFFKTRTLAAKAVAAGVRVNGVRTEKPSVEVRPGDIVTFAQGRATRVVKVRAAGERRGPATEAATLFEDLTPPQAPPPPRSGPRPTKKARRAMDAADPWPEAGFDD